MQFFVEEMNKEWAFEILNWKYEPPYDFYNNDYSIEAMTELLDGSYRGIIDAEGILFGFFCIGNSAQVPVGRQMGAYPEGFADIGLGMNPARTGKGKGTAFLETVLEQVHKRQPGMPLRLTVAEFNKRAIHLYEKFGFRKDKEFKTGFADFITMLKDK